MAGADWLLVRHSGDATGAVNVLDVYVTEVQVLTLGALLCCLRIASGGLRLSRGSLLRKSKGCMPCRRPSGLWATESGIDGWMGGLSGRLANPLPGRRMCCDRLATDGGMGNRPGKRASGPDSADSPGSSGNGNEANPGGHVKLPGGGILVTDELNEPADELLAADEDGGAAVDEGFVLSRNFLMSVLILGAR